MSILYRPLDRKWGDRYSIKPYTAKEDADVFLDMPAPLVAGALLFFWSTEKKLLNALRSSLIQKTQEVTSLLQSGVGTPSSTPWLVRTFLKWTRSQAPRWPRLHPPRLPQGLELQERASKQEPHRMITFNNIVSKFEDFCDDHFSSRRSPMARPRTWTWRSSSSTRSSTWCTQVGTTTHPRPRPTISKSTSCPCLPLEGRQGGIPKGEHLQRRAGSRGHLGRHPERR